MKKYAAYSFVISLLWLGFFGAISFMEAPVKFTAPSLTLAVGLDVGRHVFAALNKVEIGFAALLALAMLSTQVNTRTKRLFLIPLSILLTQTFWLLPALDARALVYISGQTPPPSSLHLIYIIAEGVKLLSLALLACSQLKDFSRLAFLSQAKPSRQAA
jgi:hypothetical protein